MSLGRRRLDLEDERTVQKRYRGEVQAMTHRPVMGQAPRHNLLTGSGQPQGRVMPFGALVGRVGLREPEEELLNGQGDFYIGETYAEFDNVHVFSWAAPVACTFFRGSRHHAFCDEVAVIRAFEHRGDDIVDFDDERVCEDVPEQPFRKRTLTIPDAPTRTLRRPIPPREAPPAPPPVVHEPKPSRTTSPAGSTAALEPQPGSQSSPTVRRHAPAPSEPAQTGRSAATPVRASALLHARLAAPRTKSLAPVLATLQPDQYDLVSAPAQESMIIEGQPGTGKTIIASHRAAYLILNGAPRKNRRDGDVLIVGPTRGYSRHVRAAIDRLTGGSPRVRVLSLPEVMLHILGKQGEPRGSISRSWRDVDQQLAMFVRATVTRLRSAGTRLTRHDVYDQLRRNGSSEQPVTEDPEWAAYLRRLPPARAALTMRAYIPILATIQWEVAKPADLVGIEHIIVDEAQDVTPLEWDLLASMNAAHAWTIVGDLNQRRSDHTLASWRQILDLLAIPYGDPPILRLDRGYRSTLPILRYANRLLPAAERAVVAFQEQGPEPTVEKCRSSDVAASLVRQLTRLHAAYPEGTVAVITADPKAVETMLRLAGWAKSVGELTWQYSGRDVMVAHPDTARGLEFDAVVVVEPADFPQNLGRQGPLYTALTRPNRELVVVHVKPLPERLRRRSRTRTPSRRSGT